MSNPFDYVKAINETKQDLIVDEISEKEYNPFITNRALSYFIDTVFQANEMNQRAHLQKKTQFRYLIHSIRAKKRWAGKWHKSEASADVELVMKYYGYSQAKALEVLPLLSTNQLKQIKERLDPGGVTTKKSKK